MTVLKCGFRIFSRRCQTFQQRWLRMPVIFNASSVDKSFKIIPIKIETVYSLLVKYEIG